jgi:poly(A) polymerase
LELELHRLDCLGSHGGLEIYDQLRREVRELEERPAIRPPLVDGTDLITLGMQPGPALGALLSRIRDKQLQEELNSREDALAWAAAEVKRGHE